MWAFKILVHLLLLAFSASSTSEENDEPVLYYYGLEESERGLPRCLAQQACAALLLRHWRAPALVRLCRCARRRRCDARAPRAERLELNNRAHFQFCQPITNWPECPISATALTLRTAYERMDPDELEEQHHNNIQPVPPNIVFNCRCREPNYWKRRSGEASDTTEYQCASLTLCKSGDFCGNFNEMNALYQSCLCPRHHICVHNGGVTQLQISELLYRGKGWKAYCQRVGDYSYEDY